MDWGALLFPPREPAVEERAAPSSAPPSAPEPPPVFAASEYDTWELDVTETYPDVAAFCAVALRDAEVRRARGASDEATSPPRRAPRCNRIPLGATFSGDATFQGVAAVRVVEVDSAYSTLVVRTPAGLAPLPVHWDVDDPNDPGCPSFVRDIGIERVVVQKGLLVVVAYGVTTTWVEAREDDPRDSGARRVLVREITLAKRVVGGLHARSFSSWSRPALGWKQQPRADGKVPWERLPWHDWREARVRADGTVAVPPPPQ